MNFLIVNFDQLGDVVFSSYLADFLRRTHPGAWIDVLCSSYTNQVAERYLGINDVFAITPSWRSYFGSVRGKSVDYLKIAWRLRENQYDTVYCASPHWKDVVAARLIKAKQHIGFVKRPFVKKLLTHPCEFPSSSEPIMMAMQRLVLANHPDVPVEQPRYCLRSNQENNRKEKSSIIFHPFSGDIRKTWPLENWFQLAERVRPNDSLQWIGSPNDLAKLSNDGSVPKEEIFGQGKNTTIEQTMQLFETANFVVGHDSGPIHLAGALGCRGVTIYPRLTAEKYYPQGVGSIEMLVGNPITQISVDMVYDAIQRGKAMETR